MALYWPDQYSNQAPMSAKKHNSSDVRVLEQRSQRPLKNQALKNRQGRYCWGSLVPYIKNQILESLNVKHAYLY